MRSEWTQMTLEECMEEIIDYRGKTPRKTSKGIPLVTAKVIKNGRIDNPTEFIDPEDYEGWMRRGLPKAGDVVLTTEAPLGEVAQIGKEQVALAQRVIALRGKKGLMKNSYLKYLLQYKEVQHELNSRASGTTVRGIKQRELRKVMLFVPPLEDQCAIAHTLGALDDKIELNRRQNETLEAIARAIFKSWFVDFAPVRAKQQARERGASPAEIERAAMEAIAPTLKTAHAAGGSEQDVEYLRPLASLFPDRLVESEIDLVPDGWDTTKLQTIAPLSTSSTSPSKQPDRTFEHYSIPAFDEHHWPVFEKGESIKSNKYIVSKNAVLVSKLNPVMPRIWYPPILTDMAICSTEFMQFVPQEPMYRTYLYCLMQTEEMKQSILERVTGSTGSRQRAQPKQVASLSVLVPEKELISEFDTASKPLIDRCIANLKEAHDLSSLRDTLLPKLISGELRVPEAEVIAEEATA